MQTRLLCGLALVTAFTGCADYRAVSGFAGDTTAMTGAVRGEFAQLEILCVQQATVVLVVDNIGDDEALERCEAYKRTQGRFATITIDVLDDYADGLAALAADRPFDLSPSVRSAGAKLRALDDGAGNAVISASYVDAVTRIAELLVGIYAAHRRDEAIARMVAATPDLATLGKSLKAYFVTPPDATMKAPYVNFVAVIADSTTSTQLILQSLPFRQVEPIRTAELLRDLRLRKKLLDRRTTNAPDSVPVQIGAAIDAWLAALDQFARDAKGPESRELIDRLQRLRSATRVAKDAVAVQ